MNIPAVKDWPPGSAQCDLCGGHGCVTCDRRGWFPPKTREEVVAESLLTSPPRENRRKCLSDECRNFLPPDHVAVYCSNDCARHDL